MKVFFAYSHSIRKSWKPMPLIRFFESHCRSLPARPLSQDRSVLRWSVHCGRVWHCISLSALHLYQWSLLRSTGRGQDLRALFRNMQLCSNSHYSVSACRQHHTHIVRQSDNDLVSFGITKPAAALPPYTYDHQADNLLFSKLYRKTVLPPTRW